MSATVRVVVEWEGTVIEIVNSTGRSGVLTFSDDGATTASDVAGLLEDAYRRAADALFSTPEAGR